MKRWFPVLIVFLLALGGIWFWSLGSLPDDASNEARITELEGSVTVRGSNREERMALKEMVVTEGETIVTGMDGKVTIDWFEMGETRVGPSTELVIQNATAEEDAPLHLRLRLESGRVWSRVLRLLDVEADMSVETGDVVATVRGTSFDVEKHPAGVTTVWVADSVVEAAGATVGGPSDGFFIPEGSMADFGAGGRTTSTRRISAADRETPWFKNNAEADGKFRTRVLDRLKANVSASHPRSGWLRGVTRFSERARLKAATASRRSRMESRFLLRRLAEIRAMAEEGRSGLAYQEFGRLDGEMRDRLSRPAVLAAQVLYRDVPPSSAAYRIKQQIEEWLPLVARGPGERLYARLMVIDARLDEAARSLDGQDDETAAQVLVLARQGLVNADRERRETRDLEPKANDRIRRVWKALSIRAEALDARLKSLSEPPPAIAAPAPEIEILPPTPTSTPVIVPKPIPTTTTSIVPKPVSLNLTPTSQTIGFFERVTFRAIVVYDTGLTRDVTKSTRFTASPTGYGALNANVFSATQLQGSITINAAYEEQGTLLSASSALTIQSK